MMQQLLTAAEFKKADLYTIQHKKISSLHLIERAAKAFVKEFKKHVSPKTPIAIFCGKGQNGVDGLVITRLLHLSGYTKLTVYLVKLSKNELPEYAGCVTDLLELGISCIEITGHLPAPVDATVFIDSLIGTGMKNKISAPYSALIEELNKLNKKVFAVDVPSGFPTEGPLKTGMPVLKAHLVITFELPKLNFLFPERAEYMTRFKVVKIGLSRSYFSRQSSGWQLITKKEVRKILRPRSPFSHKGTFGHALIIAGSKNTTGAAILAAEGCLMSGVGLTTVCMPASGKNALNARIPEVMYISPTNLESALKGKKYSAVGVGPGLGLGQDSKKLFMATLNGDRPLVIDADGINLFQHGKSLREDLILTPHVKEFDRLFGNHSNWWDRVQTARKQATANKWVIVLKNHYTFIAVPSGEVFVNPSGNPGMANGGQGDVLTGVITRFLAQGYSATQSAIVACFAHGLAGDELSKKRLHCTASQIAHQLPKTLRVLSVD